MSRPGSENSAQRGNTLFAGASIDVACGPDGRILATGAGARDAAGPGARRVELRGRVLPGLGDSHVHLEWMARMRRGVDLTGARSRREVLDRVRRYALRRPEPAWIEGRGWFNDSWADDPSFPRRDELDGVTGGRPTLLSRKDGHSAWLNTAGLRAAGFTRATPDPPSGVIDRDAHGEPTGIVREAACDIARAAVPAPSEAEFDTDLLRVLRELAAVGLTTVHTMDSSRLFAALQRVRAADRLPLRVVWNLPLSRADEALALGVHSGLGDEWLRIWGVKTFLDGSLGSRTAEMLDGSGVSGIPQDELVELVRRCAAGGLNVCAHAIGDRAVRRALDAFAPHRGAHPMWRPRIEHAQCVDRRDQPRFARIGVIASMQPVHAVSDRELADREWPGRTSVAYAWGALHRAGAILAFGSDAPVDDPAPLLGLDAASAWRKRAGWHPDLALSRAVALRAFTSGVAYAAGMERDVGALRPGMFCDLTIVDQGRVTATVCGGRLRRAGGSASASGLHRQPGQPRP